jgi:serine/threonine-protein kinase
MDATGKLVISPQFDDAYHFNGKGLAPVMIGDYEHWKWGYIDTTGKIVFEPQFKDADVFE